jgi:arylformamidase
MADKIFDITRTITPNLAVWPGDTPFSVQMITAIRDGSSINLTTLIMSSHMGTHVDAPYHFLDDDLTMEKVSLEAYVGPATVVTVQRETGPLIPADFPGLEWDKVKRLLVHSVASAKPIDQFPTEFIYPSPELAEVMAAHGVLLFGSDAPSMDDIDSKSLPGHKALRRHWIAILEGLIFTGIPDGAYELIALPLKIAGGDGSPVRAILRS